MYARLIQVILVNTIIGHSQFDIFGYKTNGLFQSQAEVDKAPTQIGAGPGRIRYVDINNDGVINDLDRTWIGTTLPAAGIWCKSRSDLQKI